MADQNKVEFMGTSMKTTINVNEICRFCLSDTKSCITINDKCPTREIKKFEEYSIYNFVTRLNFIKMEDNKDFPIKVCENCYSLIDICNEFSQLCQKSDALLRDCYENSLKEIENPLKDDRTKIKLMFEVPSIKEPENKLNFNAEPFTSIKLNSFPDNIVKVNKLGLNIPEVYKQKLHLVSQKVNEAHVKHTQQDLVINNDQHACSHCSLKFSTIRDLNFHNIVAHNQKRYRILFKFQCKNCPKSFSDQAKLKKHYKVIHRISQRELPDEYLNNRSKGLVDVGNFFCFRCNPNREFNSQEELVKHSVSHELDFCKEMNANVTAEKDSMQSSVLISKPAEDSAESNLTDLSAFILESVMDSLTVAQQEKQSGFRLFCKNCSPSLEFTSTSDFINHINAHHQGLKLLENWVIERRAKKDGNWDCVKCPATYTKKQSLYCHMKEKHNQVITNGMKCPEPDCYKSFKTNRQLIQHGIVVHEKYFAYFHEVFKKILQSANEEDNRKKDFECDICGKKYIYKTSLKKHIIGAHLEKSVKNPVVCSYCGKTLSNKLNLKSHIEFVHEALFVSCPICKKKINFRTIGKHYKTHKTNSVEAVQSKHSFLCNLCGKILKSKRSFEDHQKLHKNIRDELCDICGRGFTTKKFLRLHKKTHEGIQRKVFTCNQCDKAFSGRQTLNRHLLTHSGKKNFICEICSKCFYTLQELNRHVRYHKKEYRFDCQLCDMRFLDKSRFRHHMMRHRNVRPHKCQFCEKMFIVRGKMNLHMATKHNVEVDDRKGVWKDPKTYVSLDDLL